MSEARPGEDRLRDEAIDLMIRLQNDADNPVAIEMVRSWRARSPEHERAWARVAKVHGAAGKVLTRHRKAVRHERLGLTRRTLVIGGLVGLGATGAGYSLLPEVLRQARADFITGKGERRRLVLADGSIATLGPDSALGLDYTAARRGVNLLGGMAFFEVVPDAARPFAVAAGDVAVIALGTAFDASVDAGFVTVTVDHGIVEAQAPGSTPATGARLEAGEWFSFDPSSQSVDRGRREPGQIALWRDNVIIAERETVAALVTRINRWLPGRVIMADPFIGAQRVSGIFDLNDPKRALEAVVHPAGAYVRQVSSYLTVISPV